MRDNKSFSLRTFITNSNSQVFYYEKVNGMPLKGSAECDGLGRSHDVQGPEIRLVCGCDKFFLALA